MPIKGIYLAAAGTGAVVLYAGFKGKKWTDVTHAVLEGKDPAKVPSAYDIQTSPEAFTQGSYGYGGYNVSGGTVGGNAIAEDALKYQGTGYVWGGAPGNGAGHWDCSSFANAVIGRDLGMAIPMYGAGKYHGQSHGPTTVVWLVWPGAKRVASGQQGAGDLAIWQTHMGILTDSAHMISALNSSLGVQRTTIHGGAPGGEIVTYKRLKAAS